MLLTMQSECSLITVACSRYDLFLLEAIKLFNSYNEHNDKLLFLYSLAVNTLKFLGSYFHICCLLTYPTYFRVKMKIETYHQHIEIKVSIYSRL